MNGDVNVLPECLAQVGKAPGNPRQVLGRQVAAVRFVTGLAELWVVLRGEGIGIRRDCGDSIRVVLERGRKLAAGSRVKHVLGRARPIGPHAVAVLAAQQLGSCENIVGGEGPLSRNAAILRVLPTAAETDYGHDIRLPFLGWGSWPLRLSFSLRLGPASGELSSAGGTIAEYCK